LTYAGGSIRLPGALFARFFEAIEDIGACSILPLYCGEDAQASASFSALKILNVFQ
jgi:hypothetical protein